MIDVSNYKASAVDRARFARIYYIHQQLITKCYPNVPKLASKLEVTQRTVERDIEYMRDRLGAPIQYIRSRRGYHYKDNSFQLPPICLTEGELVAIFLGQKLLAQCAGTPLEGVIRSAVEKIALLMPDGISVDTNSLDHLISFDVKTLRGNEQRLAEIYNQIAGALENSKTVWMKYYGISRDEVNERNVDPYHLRYFQGAWYLIGYCHLRENIRIFALDRIQELQRTSLSFEMAPGFNVQEFLCSTLGIQFDSEPQEVVIKFDSHQARWIRERKWHSTQEINYEPDGSLILSLKVCGMGEVKRWVLGFGHHAEVIMPVDLRKEVQLEIEKMNLNYKK
ncbi:helix-turn-helix transcriptional regulator [Candidatus Contubernalis alkaliaceticus]|uniref:helix-turn-helix transcriptional regulator n=1 Tax=Candidatus Contubernalis alkaliaceticus TaxID=338645 RepID=UPI001F4C0CEC|nr:WYL domain-containing transcriptional regulator [Candidatus Contubernalis alkalaceticus]UNC93178.1 WYL domain-containing transcriptional regulator [Candidatus Contubernalis alkalaceticus]